MTYLWPISLVIIALIVCLAFLMREAMRGAVRQRELDREAAKAHPCAAAHDFVVIELRPADSAQFACKHTAVLYRCKRCMVHQAVLFPGEWEIGAFLKTEADEARLARMMNS